MTVPARRVRDLDADGLAAYWVERIETLLKAAVRDAHRIPDARRVDVEFSEFMADDFAMASRILDKAGLPVTDEASAALKAYLDGNPRGKDGKVVYDLRGDFGIDPNDLYQRYSFYFEAFPKIRKELA